MEHATQTLIVITLLQLCRAEISEIIPGTWFSANAINEGYSPKPILELFSTDPTPGFSPTKPIIVLSSSSQPGPEVSLISTSSPNYLPSSTPLPQTSSPPIYSSTYSTSSTPFPPTYTPSTLETSSTPFPSSKQSTSYIRPSSSTTTGREEVTTAFPPPGNFPVFDFPNSPNLVSKPALTTITEVNQNEGRLQFPIIETLPTLLTIPPGLIPQTSTSINPNFGVIYENTPQFFPETSSTGPLLFPSKFTTKAPTQGTPSTNTITPYITNAFSDGTSRPTITFRSTPPATSTFTTPRTTLVSTVAELTSPIPTLNVTLPPRTPATNSRVPQIFPGPPKGSFVPNLKIRIVAPKGSITNVKINPPTTTKRPLTKKPKKNTFEGCVDHCKGRKDPICAVPLGTLIVEPNMLKGFPSICQMACHNSFKKNPYEKIVDGRCGKLRTRIIRVDTNTKIHREELKKSQYTIINTGPKAVVELAGASISDRKN